MGKTKTEFKSDDENNINVCQKMLSVGYYF